MVTIIADEGKFAIGMELYQEFLSKNVEAEYITLENVQIKPCVNCGGCSYKTYGKCVIRDDGDWIYPKIIRTDVLIFVTPITFGSYSLKVKRTFDKFGVFMDRHYYLVNGELAKGGSVGKQFRYFAVGVQEQSDLAGVAAFKTLFRENLIITRGAGDVYITGTSLSDDSKSEIVRGVTNI